MKIDILYIPTSKITNKTDDETRIIYEKVNAIKLDEMKYLIKKGKYACLYHENCIEEVASVKDKSESRKADDEKLKDRSLASVTESSSDDCILGVCKNTTDGKVSDLYQTLKRYAYKKQGNEAKQKSIANNEAKDNFIRTCCGNNKNESCYISFLNHLKNIEQAYKPPMPIGLLFGLMSQESAGTCNLQGGGLFQVNKGSKEPYENLKGALLDISNKKEASDRVLSHCNLQLKDFSESDKWRIIISLYNGGAPYIKGACAKAIEYKAEYKSEKLNISSWEAISLFQLIASDLKDRNEKKDKRFQKGVDTNTTHIANILGVKDEKLLDVTYGPKISDVFNRIIKDNRS